MSDLKELSDLARAIVIASRPLTPTNDPMSMIEWPTVTIEMTPDGTKYFANIKWGEHNRVPQKLVDGVGVRQRVFGSPDDAVEELCAKTKAAALLLYDAVASSQIALIQLLRQP